MTDEQISELKKIATQTLKADKNLPEYKYYLQEFNDYFTPEIVLELIEIAEKSKCRKIQFGGK